MVGHNIWVKQKERLEVKSANEEANRTVQIKEYDHNKPSPLSP